MIARKLRAVALAACASLGLAACSTYDDGYGYGRSSYSLGLGFGSGGYYDGWGPGYGWYDGFYYPGSGYYVFDRGGRRHAWSDGQRRHWQARRGDRPGRPGRPDRENWRGDRSGLSAEARQARREAWLARRQQQGLTGDAARSNVGRPNAGAGRSDADRQARREAWRAQRQQQGAAAPAPRAERSFRGGNPGWRGNGRRGRAD